MVIPNERRTTTDRACSGATRPGHAAGPACAVCGRALGTRYRPPVDSNDICNAIECRQLWQQRDTLPAFIFEQKIRHYGVILENRARWQRERNAARAQARKRRAIARTSGEAAALQSCPDYAQHRDLIPTVQLDSPVASLSNLPRRRITAYQQHLYKVISEAFADGHRERNTRAPAPTSTQTEANPGGESLTGRLCAVCEGRCCQHGGNRAYISAETIRNIRRARPGIRPQAVFNHYMDALANRTVARSCINHTVSGCGLSRDLRSDTCNEFFCDALKDFDANCSRLSEPAAGALLISNKHARDNGLSGPFATTVYLVAPGETRELALADKGEA